MMSRTRGEEEGENPSVVISLQFSRLSFNIDSVNTLSLSLSLSSRRESSETELEQKETKPRKDKQDKLHRDFFCFSSLMVIFLATLVSLLVAIISFLT